MAKTLSELTQNHADPVTVDTQDVREANEEASAPVLVVLDDDPTGTQSVADLPVLTAWTPEDLKWGFETKKPAIYVMTNSRSLSPEDARKINREVAQSAYEAAEEFEDLKISFVSRSDSTLRGHFPLEPNVLADAVLDQTGRDVDGIVVIPAFADAGRITVDGIHYAGSEATGFTPVGETEFAKDATFGFTSSSLPEWIEEKTEGDVKAGQVIAIDLTTLRTDLDEVVAKLRGAKDRQPIICDSVTEDDLRLLALALNRAEQAGSHFLYRVGPPFVRARIGQDPKAPLSVEEVNQSRQGRETSKGGLIVIGSHVDLTTRQLNYLRDDLELEEFEIDVQQILDDETRERHISKIVEDAVANLQDGHVVVRTSRKLVRGSDGQSSLEISRRVSAAVVAVVQGIIKRVTPRFVIAKGGITSSDVASKGLAIRRATVVGPMLPGIVSLWSGQNDPARGIPYIVFAGNVGDETSLSTVVQKLSN
ncbi:MAG: four-carbon acid sugar kinase family protein [Actinomycetaceae bacterium]|nr:four-carbon acid sugar kinase family protein [Actinomycetaceae bacterium]